MVIVLCKVEPKPTALALAKFEPVMVTTVVPDIAQDVDRLVMDGERSSMELVAGLPQPLIEIELLWTPLGTVTVILVVVAEVEAGATPPIVTDGDGGKFVPFKKISVP